MSRRNRPWLRRPGSIPFPGRITAVINSKALAGGTLPIDAALAARVVDEQVATPLGLTVEEAAWGIHRVANAAMARVSGRVEQSVGLDLLAVARAESPSDQLQTAFADLLDYTERFTRGDRQAAGRPLAIRGLSRRRRHRTRLPSDWSAVLASQLRREGLIQSRQARSAAGTPILVSALGRLC